MLLAPRPDGPIECCRQADLLREPGGFHDIPLQFCDGVSEGGPQPAHHPGHILAPRRVKTEEIAKDSALLPCVFRLIAGHLVGAVGIL